MAHNVSKNIQVNGQQFDYTDVNDKLIWHEVSGGKYNGFSAHYNNGVVTGTNRPVNTLYFAPFIIEKTITITEFAIRLSAAEANRKATVGIYSSHSTNGLPDNLIIDFGEYSFPTTSAVNKTGYGQVLTKGTYYFAYILNQTTASSHTRSWYDGILGVDPDLTSSTRAGIIMLSIPYTYSTTLPSNVNSQTFTNEKLGVGIQFHYKIA